MSNLGFFLAPVGLLFLIRLGFPYIYWSLGLVSAGIAYFVATVVLWFDYKKKRHAEIRAGYSTMAVVARRYADLYWLDDRTFEVLAGPGEPRTHKK